MDAKLKRIYKLVPEGTLPVDHCHHVSPSPCEECARLTAIILRSLTQARPGLMGRGVDSESARHKAVQRERAATNSRGNKKGIR